jgi:hypothetical protein
MAMKMDVYTSPRSPANSELLRVAANKPYRKQWSQSAKGYGKQIRNNSNDKKQMRMGTCYQSHGRKSSTVDTVHFDE